MDKVAELTKLQKNEDKLLVAKVLDKIKMVQVKNRFQNTDFLDLAQKTLVEDILKKRKETNYIFWGGYKQAERTMLVLFPFEIENNKYFNQIMSAIRITLPKEQCGKYEHKTYLGAMIKLGIKREKIGDIIVKVNNKSVTESSAEEVSNIIKGGEKENIKISVLRGGITLDKEVGRKKVSIPSVESKIIDNVGYIYISTFSNTTYSQFKEALETLEKEDIKNLIIDVRGNGGGYLNSAVDIAELFIEKGKNIYGLESKGSKTFYQDETNEKRNYKINILMNGSSASASEILASALKESYNATLIGTKSYGKGTVQETQKLETGGMIKITTAYWLTPNGNKINGKGLNPDIEINGSYYEGMPYEEDIQLQEAINAVK